MKWVRKRVDYIFTIAIIVVLQGGLTEYQKISCIGEEGFDTSLWVLEVLRKEFNMQSKKPISFFDVGALRNR